MSGAFESTLLSPPRSTNKLFMETGFGVNAGFERYRNSEYAVSDGATANRAAGIYGPFDAVNNSREWIAGAASLTLPKVVTVPTGNPVADAILVGYSSSSTSLSVSNSLSVYISTSGSLNILAWASFGSAYRQFAWSGFRAAYSGQTIFLKITLTQGTTNPVVEINGVNVSANFSLTTATPPAWLEASMVPTYRLVGYNWPSGPAPIVTPILGQTSAADDAFYMQTGKWPAWVARGGWAQNQVTGTLINVGCETFTGASSTGVTASDSDGYASIGFPIVPFIRGTQMLISFDYSAGSNLSDLKFTTNGSGGPDVNIGLTGASGTYSGTYANSGTAIGIYGGYFSITISNLKIVYEGALSLPAVQPINVLDDVSGIGTNCGLILGAATTATSNKKVWRIADLTKTSGNEQLLGGAVFVGTSQDYIKSWTIVNAGGTTTVSLGNVSGGAQYVSGLSVPTGTTVVTLLTNTPLTTNLWCNASTTASLTHIIEGYRTA